MALPIKTSSLTMILYVILGILLLSTASSSLTRRRLDGCRGFNATSPSLSHLVLDIPEVPETTPKVTGVLDLLPKVTGVFVAGTNCLVHLSPDLDIRQEVATGPQEDSLLCSARGSCQQGALKTPTDNVNKVLLVEGTGGERSVLACGNVFQGVCERYPVEDVSRKLERLPVPVVDNEAAGSGSVVFVGPGLPDPRSHRVMYVAAAHTLRGPYRSQEEIPVLSSRNLKTFEIIRARRFVQARLKIASQYLETFQVKYISGFYDEGYAYFAMIQPAVAGNPDEGFVSKIARVCGNDPSFESYMELTLVCQSKGHRYPLLTSLHLLDQHGAGKVLVGAFAAAEGSAPTASAVCLFPMDDLLEMFERNARQCFSGTRQSRGLGFIAGASLPCPKDPRVMSDFCNEHLMIEGSLPVSSEALVAYTDDPITAVTALVAPATGPEPRQSLVVLVGTRKGHVRKLLLKSPHVGLEYAHVDLNQESEGGRVGMVREMKVDEGRKKVFVLTETEVILMDLDSCSAHATCRDCLHSRDPFCGWCSLEKRCTTRQACAHPPPSTHHGTAKWLPFSAQQCIDFVALTPDRISVQTSQTKIELTIKELPLMAGSDTGQSPYSCVFGTSDSQPVAVVPANFSRNGLACMFSPRMLADRWPEHADTDHLSVVVDVRSQETQKDFIHHTLTIYNCAVHQRCQSCVNSPYNCSWCSHSHTCLDSRPEAEEQCQLAANGVAGLVGAVEQCPHLSPTGQQETVNDKEGGKEAGLLLPNMAAKAIVLSVDRLPAHKDAVFECLLETEHRLVRVPAQLRPPAALVCQETAYFYHSETAEQAAALSVVWNGNHYIDTINVTLYKCRLKGADCSTCRSLPAALQCGWVHDECQFVGEAGREEGGTGSCPAPTIDSISPVSGPVDGGTLITIMGRELGQTMDDLTNAITVAGVPCRPVEYQVSRRVVCRTDPLLAQSTRAGPVSITLPGRAPQSSFQKFYFLNTTLARISPRVGIRSGGTRVTLAGNHLDIGSNLSIAVAGQPCRVDRASVTANRLVCTTTPGASTGPVVVHIDNGNRTLSVDFQYVNDPVVTGIDPSRAFISGGNVVSITGENFAVVQNVRMNIVGLSDRKVINSSDCTIQNGRTVLCPTPAVEKVNATVDYAVRMEMDGWMDKKLLKITYLPDPVIYPFEEPQNTRLFQGEVLLIEGERLDTGITPDPLVTIGDEICNITSLSSTRIVCQPGRLTAGTPQMVMVHLGDVELLAGYLQIPGAVEAEQGVLVSSDVVTGVSVGVVGCLVVTAGVLWLVCRRSSRAEREYKRIQLQLDTLESHVRMECKQAFAELQTDISDLASEVHVAGIPYVEPATYLLRIFFPLSLGADRAHPVLQDVRPCRNNRCTGFEATMAQFEQLLCKDVFLISFIGALESQRTFGIRDRANVASLLTLVFLDKLDYLTQIFQQLMVELMQRSALSKHPQLMLRRSESVVEKMLSNWIGICMLETLQDHLGPPLFLLVQAVKTQVEKGPVDCLTHQARYSLSEDHLLREQLPYHSVLIDLHQDELDEKVQCRVLDCDSISQVKGKLLDALYKSTTPSSTRPSLYEIDLEWHNSTHGRLLLQDDDATSTAGPGGWRRINTLAHYGIRESAVMTLVLRSQEAGYLCEISPYSVSARDYHSGKVWHLSQGAAMEKGAKIPEIYLTRLISTKGTLGKYVDDLVGEVFRGEAGRVPPGVKWLFDLYDRFGNETGMVEAGTVHAWKSNSLPLRFWANLIKTPELLLDMQKSPTVESSLAVIAQCLMESCAWNENQRLDKDSPCSKLLFAKDMPVYRQLIRKYYADVQTLPSVSDGELMEYMRSLSKKYAFHMNVTNALKELFSYAVKYQIEICEKLEENLSGHLLDCNNLELARTFESLCNTASNNYFSLPVPMGNGQSGLETLSKPVYATASSTLYPGCAGNGQWR